MNNYIHNLKISTDGILIAEIDPVFFEKLSLDMKQYITNELYSCLSLLLDSIKESQEHKKKEASNGKTSKCDDCSHRELCEAINDSRKKMKVFFDLCKKIDKAFD